MALFLYVTFLEAKTFCYFAVHLIYNKLKVGIQFLHGFILTNNEFSKTNYKGNFL
jgi:hypothetical protein